jgi:hypothetical protein
VLTVLGLMGYLADSGTKPPTSKTAEESAAEAHSRRVWDAIFGCQAWTVHNAKLGVGEIVDRYELTTRLPKNHVAVAIAWRASGSGLLMYSRCEYAQVGNGTEAVLVKAWSRPQYKWASSNRRPLGFRWRRSRRGVSRSHFQPYTQRTRGCQTASWRLECEILQTSGWGVYSWLPGAKRKFRK